MDVQVENHGSIVLLRPMTPQAKEWIAENIGEHQSFGDAVVCEPRYVSDIVDGMIADGLEIE